MNLFDKILISEQDANAKAAFDQHYKDLEKLEKETNAKPDSKEKTDALNDLKLLRQNAENKQKELEERKEKGLQLFIKYYQHLWD